MNRKITNAVKDELNQMFGSVYHEIAESKIHRQSSLAKVLAKLSHSVDLRSIDSKCVLSSKYALQNKEISI
ncbi:MAG: hypothetical protein ACW99Q_17475 [Candidatus Kariarchaeaceae archaeon]